MSAFPWYRSSSGATAVSAAVAQRAVQWLVALQADAVAPEVVSEWERWRAAHPEHERAWLRIESVRGRLQPLSSPQSSAIAQAALTPAVSQHRRRTLKALSFLAVAGGAGWLAERSTPWREWSSDYRTRIGERRTLPLPDGTQLVLNTGSAINVAFTDTERRIVLIAGEILIKTAQEGRAVYRPFLVETAFGTARALGTEYAVRQLEASTQVSVYAGAVQIEPRHHAGQTLVLHAGERGDYSADAAAPAGVADDTTIAWKDGFIVARSMRLDDFLAELARYSDDTLSCDPAVAGLRLSGSFPVNDIRKGLAALAVTLDLKIETQTPLWRAKVLRLVPALPSSYKAARLN